MNRRTFLGRLGILGAWLLLPLQKSKVSPLPKFSQSEKIGEPINWRNCHCVIVPPTLKASMINEYKIKGNELVRIPRYNKFGGKK